MGGGGYDSGSASDDDEEEEYEEVSGNRFLGFMFGNVDNSGDLDADYLDEDAKEHLAALADKLGSSLTEIDVWKICIMCHVLKLSILNDAQADFSPFFSFVLAL
ncbi:hypothetical protein OIU74_015739 [Salix koriyanagi]|uniref:TAFII-230 TBP-binding domain-containing protein n=1 Tax=Salix koriyanagi TaxID=2511006 RepID=A0A9Q0PN71_9ROSI|nr:hypothetical protein OIU74_015739 [Salix koriyanagi]